jgi:hypothetical protein
MTYTPEQIAAVAAWQAASWVHPLTCGQRQGHPEGGDVLIPRADGLYCPTCDYYQARIPNVCLGGPPPNPWP